MTEDKIKDDECAKLLAFSPATTVSTNADKTAEAPDSQEVRRLKSRNIRIHIYTHIYIYAVG